MRDEASEIQAVVGALARLMLRRGAVYENKSPGLDDAMREAEEIVQMALASDEDKSILNRQIGELQAAIGRLQSVAA